VAAGLALLGALSWGAGDFLGGLAARRVAVVVVLVVSQAIGLAGVALWVLATGDPFPGAGELAPAAAAGVAGLAGLAALYRGLAIGTMGVVAPISALSPVVPLTVDAARGSVPTSLQWLGIAVALAGVTALSYTPSGGRSRLAAGAGLAALSALGFGAFVVGLDAGADESAAWAVVAARCTSVGVAIVFALLGSASLRSGRPVLHLLLGVAVFDTGANVLIAVATTHASAGVVGVLSALYPVATVLLARLVLGERLSGTRRLGAAAAIAGAALVAAG
jgi:uncharacterized membrane protein